MSLNPWGKASNGAGERERAGDAGGRDLGTGGQGLVRGKRIAAGYCCAS